MVGITPDPKKRSYLLPPGCKDLIDVLQPRGRRVAEPLIEADRSPTMLHTGECRGGLTEIERHVAMVFESRAVSFTLDVTPLDERFTIEIYRMDCGISWACVRVPQGTEQEAHVRGFFTRHGLPTPENTTVPEVFFANLPVYLGYDLSPVRDDPAQLARFMASLLSEVCDVSDDSGLIFRYHETIALSPPGTTPPA